LIIKELIMSGDENRDSGSSENNQNDIITQLQAIAIELFQSGIPWLIGMIFGQREQVFVNPALNNNSRRRFLKQRAEHDSNAFFRPITTPQSLILDKDEQSEYKNQMD
jgi:hypothetical protein